jgi:hypothetical protein
MHCDAFTSSKAHIGQLTGNVCGTPFKFGIAKGMVRIRKCYLFATFSRVAFQMFRNWNDEIGLKHQSSS